MYLALCIPCVYYLGLSSYLANEIVLVLLFYTLGNFLKSNHRPEVELGRISSSSDLGAHDLSRVLCLPPRRHWHHYISRHTYCEHGDVFLYGRSQKSEGLILVLFQVCQVTLSKSFTSSVTQFLSLYSENFICPTLSRYFNDRSNKITVKAL